MKLCLVVEKLFQFFIFCRVKSGRDCSLNTVDLFVRRKLCANQIKKKKRVFQPKSIWGDYFDGTKGTKKKDDTKMAWNENPDNPIP